MQTPYTTRRLWELMSAYQLKWGIVPAPEQLQHLAGLLTMKEKHRQIALLIELGYVERRRGHLHVIVPLMPPARRRKARS